VSKADWLPGPSAPDLTEVRSGAAPAARTTPRRPPDFFIVGHPKSGTTALYEMLRRHPQIYMPEDKETWYFAPELHLRPPPRPTGIARTLDEYLSLFDAATERQRIGEASPMYLWSPTAAARIADVQPDAQIIAILREPASFLRSLHLQFVEVYVETESDFRRAIELEDSRREGRNISRYSYWPRALMYSEYVRYVEQLRRFESRFGRERLLVLVYDDFRSDNDAVVRKVLRFLEVDDSVPVEAVEANPTVGVRSQGLHELVHALSVGHGPVSAAIKRALKALTPRQLRRGALRMTQRRLVFSDPEQPDLAFMRELRSRFKPEVVALSEHLERDLVALWGYDDVE
jgi:sulfotransferase family protein